jgi:hypothetical protein
MVDLGFDRVESFTVGCAEPPVVAPVSIDGAALNRSPRICRAIREVKYRIWAPNN